MGMAAPPTAEELKVLAANRLAEAKALLQLEHYAGAWYLAGYAVELALKAVVCRTLGLPEYPDSAFRGSLKSHYFRDLVILAGLTRDFDVRSRNHRFVAFWDLVTTWDVQDRYKVDRTEQQVREFVNAIDDVQDGVLIWLSNRW